MKTIKHNVKNEIIINKSRFICFLHKINSETEINQLLEKLKKEYKGATHYCYAYILGNVKRFNDDGEPNGTAGIPILNVLEKNELNHILAVVIRYFGGVKLGAGGLVRAYSTSVSECLNKTKIVNMVEGYEITIKFNYEKSKIIDHILKDYNILNKKFSDNITYVFKISSKNYEKIEKQIKDFEINKKSIFVIDSSNTWFLYT